MYEELIKWLREVPTLDVDAKMHNEAANAIEELQLYADLYKDLVERLEKILNNIKKRR